MNVWRLKTMTFAMIAFISACVIILFINLTDSGLLVVIPRLQQVYWTYLNYESSGKDLVDNTIRPTMPKAKEREMSQQAFYDDVLRKGIGRRAGPKLNISLIAAFESNEQIEVTITSTGKYGDTVHCRYFNESKCELRPGMKSVVFPEFTVQCPRRDGARYMSLSDTFSGEFEFPVPITDRTRNEATHFFSVCLSPLYGTEPKWLLMAEFFEHYKLQGASHFFVYVINVDEYSNILLHDYVRTGEVELIYLHNKSTRTDNWWHIVQIQTLQSMDDIPFACCDWKEISAVARACEYNEDCLIRSRGYSSWVAFVDLDERLLPTEYTGTLSDYLKNLSNPKIGALQFRQRWILRNDTLPDKYVDREQVSGWMPTKRYHNTSHVGPAGHTTKCIVDPKKVFIMNVHYVDKFFEGFSMHKVKPEEGIVRHYRDVKSGEWGKRWLKGIEQMGSFSTTGYPDELLAKLEMNAWKRIHLIYGR